MCLPFCINFISTVERIQVTSSFLPLAVSYPTVFLPVAHRNGIDTTAVDLIFLWAAPSPRDDHLPSIMQWPLQSAARAMGISHVAYSKRSSRPSDFSSKEPTTCHADPNLSACPFALKFDVARGSLARATAMGDGSLCIPLLFRIFLWSDGGREFRRRKDFHLYEDGHVLSFSLDIRRRVHNKFDSWKYLAHFKATEGSNEILFMAGDQRKIIWCSIFHVLPSNWQLVSHLFIGTFKCINLKI